MSKDLRHNFRSPFCFLNKSKKGCGLHLRVRKGRLPLGLMITEENKQKRQGYLPCLPQISLLCDLLSRRYRDLIDPPESVSQSLALKSIPCMIS